MDKLYRKKLEKIFNKIDSLAGKGRDNIIEYYKYIDELILKGDYGAFQETLYLFYEIDIIEATDVRFVKDNTWDEIMFQTKSTFLKKLSRLYKQRGVYQQSYDIYSEDLNNVQISISDKLSSTYSVTGITASVSLERNGEIIYLSITDSDIKNIDIYRSEWIDGIPSNIETLQSINVTQSYYKTEIPTSHGRQYLIETTQIDPNFVTYNYKVDIVKTPIVGSIFEIEEYAQDIKYLIQNKQYARLIGERKTYLEVKKIGVTQSYIIDYDNYTFTEEQNLLKRYELALDILLS